MTKQQKDCTDGKMDLHLEQQVQTYWIIVFEQITTSGHLDRKPINLELQNTILNFFTRLELWKKIIWFFTRPNNETCLLSKKLMISLSDYSNWKPTSATDNQPWKNISDCVIMTDIPYRIGYWRYVLCNSHTKGYYICKTLPISWKTIRFKLGTRR